MRVPWQAARGNFGVVTRYWLRSPGATGDPSRLLPASPRQMLECVLVWLWEGSQSAGLFGLFMAQHRNAGYFTVVAQPDRAG